MADGNNNRDGSRSSASPPLLPAQRHVQLPTNAKHKDDDPSLRALKEEELPVCKPFSQDAVNEARKDGALSECQLWNPLWNPNLTDEGEAFLGHAACLGYTEDQALAVLYVCKFDLRMARERLPKFRNIHIPICSDADKLTFNELLSIHGKKFHLFRTALPNMSVKEMVNLYYYQKEFRRRQSACSTVIRRRTLERQRQRISEEMRGTSPNAAPVRLGDRNDKRITCVSCFKRCASAFRCPDGSHLCGDCYTFIRVNREFPPSPKPDPFSPTLSWSPPTAGEPLSAEISQRIAAAEREGLETMVRARTMELKREFRRELQLLERAKDAAPSPAQYSQLMAQLRGVLTEDNGGGSKSNAIVLE